MLSLLSLMLVTACATAPTRTELLVSLVADGRERTFAYDTPVTVGEFLRDAQVELSDLDRVNPQPFTQITNGMVVSVVRVQEESECVEEEIPYRQRNVLNEGLAPGEERIGQAGQNGVQSVCYRIRIEDGIRQSPVETSRVVINSPQDEVVYVGPSGTIDPVNIVGTLAYISNQNAWLMRGSSVTKRPITTDGDLDSVVFELSDDGNMLLFTRRQQAGISAQAEIGFSNTLWIINNLSNADAAPIQLVPQDVLQAHWIPNLPNTISYSTGESSDTAPGWRAYNDLWAMRIAPETGETLRVEEVVPSSSFGLYSWWGTPFFWSPAGDKLAWVRADSLGLVDLDSGEFTTLIEYPVFNTRQSWSWRATVSWSPDNDLIATTIHVPIGNYPPETSPAFSTAVVAADGSFSATMVDNSGIWSSPKFSPPLESTNGTESAFIAYLRARDPFNSINGEYDLVVADRDGSNARMIFPPSAQEMGLLAQEFTWSPDGTQIAFIYQGNLWIIDVITEIAQQLTLDGSASQPTWK